jgi:hypothetical protein
MNPYLHESIVDDVDLDGHSAADDTHQPFGMGNVYVCEQTVSGFISV